MVYVVLAPNDGGFVPGDRVVFSDHLAGLGHADPKIVTRPKDRSHLPAMRKSEEKLHALDDRCGGCALCVRVGY
jgi:hypothetical protein